MRVLLQNFETGLFYNGPNSWTRDALLAYDFESVQHAVDTYKHERIEFATILVAEGPSLGHAPWALSDEVRSFRAAELKTGAHTWEKKPG